MGNLCETGGAGELQALFEADDFYLDARPMWIYDSENLQILDVNAAAVRSYGYSIETFLSMTIRDLRPQSEWKALDHDLQTAPRGLCYSSGWIHKKADGTQIFVDIISQPVICRGRRARLVLANDVTPRHDEQNTLMYLAHRDELTGLPKRTHLAEVLEASVYASRRGDTLTGVAFVDLNGFKEVNDTYGHHAGDRILVAVAQRLSQVIRSEDTVARLGGDEFVVILSNVAHREQIAELVQRLSDAFADPFVIQRTTITMSASIGVSIFPIDAVSPEALLRCSDEAMYRAKGLPQRICFFADERARGGGRSE